jgi:hypothetical protein
MTQEMIASKNKPDYNFLILNEVTHMTDSELLL